MTSRRFVRRSQPAEPDIYKKSVCFSDDSSSLSSSYCDDDSAGVLSPARAYTSRHAATPQCQGQVEDMAMRQLESLRSRCKPPPPSYRSKSPSSLNAYHAKAYTNKDPASLLPLNTSHTPAYVKREPIIPPRRSKTPTFAVSSQRYAPTSPPSSSYDYRERSPHSILKRQETESSSASETSSTMFQVHHVSRPKTPTPRPKTPTSRPKTPTSRPKTPISRPKTPTFRSKTPTDQSRCVGAVEVRVSRRSAEPRADDRMLTNSWTSIRDKSCERRPREKSRERLPKENRIHRCNLSPPADHNSPTSPSYSTLPRPFTATVKPQPRSRPQSDDEEVSELLNSRATERFYYTEVDTGHKPQRKQWGNSVTNQYKHQSSTVSPRLSVERNSAAVQKNVNLEPRVELVSDFTKRQLLPPSPMKESKYKKNLGKVTTKSNEPVVRVPARPTTPSNLRRTPLYKSTGRLSKIANPDSPQLPKSNLMRMSTLGKSLCDSLSPPQTDHNCNVISANSPPRQDSGSAFSVQADVQLAIDEARVVGGPSVRDIVNNANWVLSDNNKTGHRQSLVPPRQPAPRAPNHPLIDRSRPFSPFTAQQQQRASGPTPAPTPPSRQYANPISARNTSFGIPLFGSSTLFGRRKSQANMNDDIPTTTGKLPMSDITLDTTPISTTPAIGTLPRRYVRRKTLGANSNADTPTSPVTPTASSGTPTSAVQRLLKYTRAKSCERLDDIGK